MIAVTNLAIRVRNLVVGFFPIWLAAAIAAVNAATDRSAKGYIVAAATALLTTVVSPAVEKAATKTKVVDPKLVESVLAAINAREAVQAAFADDLAITPIDPTVVVPPA